ncbi:MAG: pyruvate kinase [Thermodesulfobacteriota bacterium]
MMKKRLDIRKTKIVATIGPSSSSPEAVEGLVRAGVNVVRLNLSHGSRPSHEKAVAVIREVSARLNRPVAILLDLQGPKIRVGALKGGKPVELKAGGAITLTPEEIEGDASRVTVTYKDLYRDVSAGDKILIDDGLIEVRVEEVKGTEVECAVVYGGLLGEHKGFNLPGVSISAPALTGKDIDDMEFGVRAEVDYIALSFVRKAADVSELKDRLRGMLHGKGKEIPVIAKIEKAEAIGDLEAIMEESDGIMIARGDLGVELSPERVPVLQKKIIMQANEAGKVVITATQMLESMIKNPRPTRAEASDVANAVFDGTDALMLSGETAVGSYPVKAVEMMVKIAEEAEEAALAQRYLLRRKDHRETGSFTQAVAFAALAASSEVGSKAVVVFSESGDTARVMSKLRPTAPIVAFTSRERTCRRLALIWGVQPFRIDYGEHTDEMICRGEAALLDNGLARLGDTIVILSGTKFGMRGATNMMKIDWIGSEECRLYLKKEPEGTKP